MKRTLFFILVLIFSKYLLCQSVYDNWYKNKPDGIHKEYHKNDSLAILLVKKNGFIETYIGYYPNGKIYFEHYYKNGKATGAHTGYNIDGRLINLFLFDNDTIKYCEYLDYFDFKIFTVDRNNKNIRKRIIWEYNSDFLKCIKNESELIGDKAMNIGQMYGKHIYYYKNGTVKKRVQKCKGLMNNTREYFDKSGEL